MIGNDIVDLQLRNGESNWQRKRYLEKIFTKDEQVLIWNSNNPESMVWNLWTRKEAAYKIYNRITGIRSYFPSLIECFEIESKQGFIFGKVIIQDIICFTKTEINSAYCYTIATLNSDIFSTIKIIKNRTDIIKNNGIPSYYDPNTKTLHSASISNDGRFERIIAL
jgi:phosphopantetheinyl transferase (holo-ACP synthase)